MRSERRAYASVRRSLGTSAYSEPRAAGPGHGLRGVQHRWRPSNGVHRPLCRSLRWFFAIPNSPIDAANTFDRDCRPFAEIPAWWSGFLFHVLTPRQLCLYLYLAMLGQRTGVCHPTVKQIRQDLGLASESAVFEALAALDEMGFILRAHRRVRTAGARRNVYQRAACEYTMVRLLKLGKIDGSMRPAPGFVNEISDDAKALRDEWLTERLGAAYRRYAEAADEAKPQLLIELLEAFLARSS
jgi:hypothetical protein